MKKSQFAIVDGLAQKARDGKLSSDEINLALSILLEDHLRIQNDLGVVDDGPNQDDIITSKIKVVDGSGRQEDTGSGSGS